MSLINVATQNNVTTLTMNNPKKLNGWTAEMMLALRAGLTSAAEDPHTKVLVLTGTGRYFSAGVNLGGTLEFGHPKVLRERIIAHNQELFELFIDFPKPILVAMNGHGIGAPVTSATCCDGIIAANNATLSTPFTALGVPPEGCSSVLFERLMGADNAQRMLGPEGWKPTAPEAKDVGLIEWVAAPDELMAESQKIAEGWVKEGRARTFRGDGTTKEELKAVNAAESIQVADAFLSAPFLKGQFEFLWSKKKRGPALFFLGLRATRPVWSLML